MSSKKVTVTLDSPDQWRKWIEVLQSYADTGEDAVWDLIDPEKWDKGKESTTPLGPEIIIKDGLRYETSSRHIVNKPLPITL